MRLPPRLASHHLAWAVVAWLAGCAAPQPDRLTLEPVPYSDLPGWQADHAAAALPALRESCAQAPALSTAAKATGIAEAEMDAGWRRACAAVSGVPAGDDAAFRRMLEEQFQPYAVGNNARRDGLMTGYFEPEFAGSRVADGQMRAPLLARPNDLVEADLAGRTIVGRLQDGAVVPYWDRAQIEAGALGNQAKPIAFLASPIDVFFLQIQGSGRVLLGDGEVLRVGFDGRNGRPYVPIGRVLVERGRLLRSEVTMQSIRAWLEQHPQEADEVMAQNPSYVFFRVIDGLAAGDGPIGALGVKLTPGRSIAVDRAHIPLGLPVWVETTDPLDASALRRLMLAQDTGGAIKGPVRGDIFFGWGADAALRAGAMQQPGRLTLLLPRRTSP
ncbi:MAG: MltA domain-containing protein [Acetobacteraceae bacterium]